jgi:hypothetical protein
MDNGKAWPACQGIRFRGQPKAIGATRQAAAQNEERQSDTAMQTIIHFEFTVLKPSQAVSGVQIVEA